MCMYVGSDVSLAEYLCTHVALIYVLQRMLQAQASFILLVVCTQTSYFRCWLVCLYDLNVGRVIRTCVYDMYGSLSL